MARILVVHHTPSPPTRELLEAVLGGLADPDLAELGDIDAAPVPALSATVPDVLAADGYLFGTPANFGYMSGALKHFFDTVYYPVLGAVAGRPYGLWVHGNDDTAGAVRSVERIAGGLGLVPAFEVVSVTAPVQASDRERCAELAATVAATALGAGA